MSTTKAVYVTKSGVTLKEGPSIPTPSINEVLIKNVVVASNPKDWKCSHWGIWEGIEGNDVAGFVEQVGDQVTLFKKGDKVGAFTPMMKGNSYGAYQSYSLAPQHTTFHIAPNTSFEEAATIPLAVLTAVIGLFASLQLPEPSSEGEKAPNAEKTTVLIWGAASSVGSFAVQLAKKAGFYVIGVAGDSTDYAKSLGVDVVFNYKTEKDIVQAILNAAPTPIHHVYDAISTESTTPSIIKILDQSGGGIVTTVLPNLDKFSSEKSKVVQTSVGNAHDGKKNEFCERWIRQIARWLGEGKFKGNQVRVMPKGLASVEEGLRLLKENKVSAEKLVYRIEDTPPL